MSPLNYVNEKTVPTVMTYGAEDILVGHEHGEKLNAKLNQYGVDHTYLTMTKSNHTAEMDSSTIQKFWECSVQYGEKYLNPQI